MKLYTLHVDMDDFYYSKIFFFQQEHNLAKKNISQYVKIYGILILKREHQTQTNYFL